MNDDDMDDINDASEAVWRVSESLRLAGVDTDAVAGALIGRGISLKLMEGESVEEVLDDIENMTATLARHIADRK